MAYELQEESGLLRVTFSGTLTNSDLSRAADAVGRIEASRDVAPNRISDLRPVDRLEIDFPGVFALADTRRRVKLRSSIKSAIIASDVVHFGFARMFQTLNDHPQIVIAIFGDDEQALRWLRAPDLRPPDVAWRPRPP